MKKQTMSTRTLTTLGMLAALALVLVSIIHFPIIPAAPFLEYDPADIPIFVGAFLFGPAAGFALTVIVSVIQGLTVSAASGGVIGIFMHIFATGTYVLLAGTIYKKNRTRKGAVLAMATGSLAMTAVMCLWNLIFTPLFLGRELGEVAAMLIPAIIPFNLIKAGINSIVTYLVYKPVGDVIFRNEAKAEKNA